MPIIQKIKKIDWIIIAIFLINVSLISYYFSQKTEFHVDEYFTFGVSNSPEAAFLIDGVDTSLINKTVFSDLAPTCLDMDIGHKYLTVQENERFDYRVRYDHHPPLYYFMIHTIFSFFPETFNRWLGFLINIVFFIMTFFLLYKFAREFFGDRVKAYLTIIFWGFCLTTLNMSVFIRSYMMQMFIGTFLLYEHYQLFKQEKVKFANLFKIFLFSYIGFMTHFYFLVFSFFCAAISCLFFLRGKKIRSLFVYVAVILLSVLLYFVSFPLAIDILFNSQRAVEMRTHSWRTYYFYHLSFIRLIKFVVAYVLAFDSMHSYLFSVILACVISGIVLQNEREKTSSEICFLTICVVLFLVFAALVVPNDIGKWYDRYFAPVVPVLCLLIVYYFILFLKVFHANEKIINIILLFLVLLNVFCTNWEKRSGYFFRETKNVQGVFEELSGKKILLLDATICELVTFIGNNSSFKSLCVLGYKNADTFLSQVSNYDYDYIVTTDFGEVEDGVCKKRQELQVEGVSRVNCFNKGMGYYYELYKIDSIKSE